MLDPAECGPAFIALPQDVQAEAYDFPLRLFEPVVHEIARPRPDAAQVAAAVAAVRESRRPLIVAGGGVHYSLAEEALASFAARHGIPVVETVAGKSTLTHDHPCYAGPIGVVGAEGANRLAAEADVVLAVGTRLGDFATGSWSVFQNPDVRLVDVNAARFDARKHGRCRSIGDAREVARRTRRRARRLAGAGGVDGADRPRGGHIVGATSTTSPSRDDGLPTYAQVVRAISDRATEHDYALTASGGFPGELNNGWRSRGVDDVRLRVRVLVHGLRAVRRMGCGDGPRALAPDGDTIVFVGDGSYLMLNSDLYSSVLSGHKMIVVLCDNGGYAVIDRLQVSQGGEPFNNLLRDVRAPGGKVRVDFVAHAAAMGCEARKVATIDELARRSTGRGRPTARPSSSSRPIRTRGPRAARGGRSAYPRRRSGRRSSRPAPRSTTAKRCNGGAYERRRLACRRARLRADRADARRAA